jgi:alkylated DNA repair protein (DNA oxidative demethylase)
MSTNVLMPSLFSTAELMPPGLPAGFEYQENLISAVEEEALLAAMGEVEFSTFEMHGVTARRRVAHFGWLYEYNSWRLTRAVPLPSFLLALRERIARWTGDEPESFAEALINQYPPGAGIGWHRDAPVFERIAGVSLAADCDFRLRRGPGPARETLRWPVARRSVYLLSGEARSDWQHMVPPMKQLRYSITFRTLRGGPKT